MLIDKILPSIDVEFVNIQDYQPIDDEDYNSFITPLEKLREVPWGTLEEVGIYPHFDVDEVNSFSDAIEYNRDLMESENNEEEDQSPLDSLLTGNAQSIREVSVLGFMDSLEIKINWILRDLYEITLDFIDEENEKRISHKSRYVEHPEEIPGGIVKLVLEQQDKALNLFHALTNFMQSLKNVFDIMSELDLDEIG